MGFRLYSMTPATPGLKGIPVRRQVIIRHRRHSRWINIALRAGGVCLTKWEQVQIVLTLRFPNPQQSNHQNSQLIEITWETVKPLMAVELRLPAQVLYVAGLRKKSILGLKGR